MVLLSFNICFILLCFCFIKQSVGCEEVADYSRGYPSEEVPPRITIDISSFLQDQDYNLTLSIISSDEDDVSVNINFNLENKFGHVQSEYSTDASEWNLILTTDDIAQEFTDPPQSSAQTSSQATGSVVSTSDFTLWSSAVSIVPATGSLLMLSLFSSLVEASSSCAQEQEVTITLTVPSALLDENVGSWQVVESGSDLIVFEYICEDFLSIDPATGVCSSCMTSPCRAGVCIPGDTLDVHTCDCGDEDVYLRPDSGKESCKSTTLFQHTPKKSLKKLPETCASTRITSFFKTF